MLQLPQDVYLHIPTGQWSQTLVLGGTSRVQPGNGMIFKSLPLRWLHQLGARSQGPRNPSTTLAQNSKGPPLSQARAQL